MDDVAKYVLYTTVGACMTFGDSLVIAAIVKSKKLRQRKEILIVLSLCVGDLVLGLAFLTCGPYRLALTLKNNSTPMSPLDCMFLPFNPMFAYGAQCSTLMLFMVSCDRLMSVHWPATYMSLTTHYTRNISALVYGGYGSITLVAAYIGSYTLSDTVVSPMCFGANIWTHSFYMYHVSMQAFVAVGSCLVYALVVASLRYRHATRLNGNQLSHAQLASRKRQEKVTKILALVVLITMVFYATPYIFNTMAAVFKMDLGIFATYSVYGYVLTGVNSILNILNYTIRHEDIRLSIKELFCNNRVVPINSLSHPTAY